MLSEFSLDNCVPASELEDLKLFCDGYVRKMVLCVEKWVVVEFLYQECFRRFNHVENEDASRFSSVRRNPRRVPMAGRDVLAVL